MNRCELSFRDEVLKNVCRTFLVAGSGTLLLAAIFLLKESGFPTHFFARAVECFTGEWQPLATPPLLGLAHAWAATIIVTGIGLLISVPFGFGIGLFNAEIGPEPLRKILSPAIELLAGIPAVVFGFFGAVTLLPFMESQLQLPTGETLLGAGVVLAVMMLPFIASTSEGAFRAAFRSYRESALALGITQWYLLVNIILKVSFPGLIAAVALGFARGVGETLAVLMLSGNTSAFPESLISRGQPLTALLATEIGETAVGSDKYEMLFQGAFFLLLIVFTINVVIFLLKKRVLTKIGGTHG